MGEETVESAVTIQATRKAEREIKPGEPWWKRNPFRKRSGPPELPIEKLSTSGKPPDMPAAVGPDGKPLEPIPHPDAIPDTRITAGGPARIESSEEEKLQTTRPANPGELPPMAQKSVDKLLNQYPGPDTPESVQPFNPNETNNGLDEIGTGDKIVSPPFKPGTASNVTSINRNPADNPPQSDNSGNNF